VTLGSEQERECIGRAVRVARDTRLFEAEPGIRHRTGSCFLALFGRQRAIVIADGNTFPAAGRDVEASLEREGVEQQDPFVFGPHVHADADCVEELERFLRPFPSIPIAVGSGTLNDLTKLAAHRLNRPYMVVGTAASMDGYAAFGASILKDGSKDTMDCPGPRAVLADLEVIGRAPAELNSSGYGDLLAKIPAGADWMLADAVGVEPIVKPVWDTVQVFLRSWVDSPAAIPAREPAPLAHLVQGLVMSGLAMQELLSSRPASGAEHQFSHLWDMQQHTFRGEAPSHGFKVGIGTLASIALYEHLLTRDIASLDVNRAVAVWPSLEDHQNRVLELFGPGGLARRASEETRAKYIGGEALRAQLTRLRDRWGELSSKLRTQLISFQEAREMLSKAGCPCDPAQIGISRARLRVAYEQCCYLRRRFTVLDLAHRTGLLPSALAGLFGPRGPWTQAGGAVE
jgi:glycerol-1-phosphate dehydrogenase [NAD(P)+]